MAKINTILPELHLVGLLYIIVICISTVPARHTFPDLRSYGIHKFFSMYIAIELRL